VGHQAGTWRRKPLVLAAFACLPLRAILLSIDAHWGALFGAAALDGLASGIMLVLFYAIVANFTAETPHRNVVIGIGLALGTAGALCANGLGGILADTYGFTTAFLSLAAIGAAGFAHCLIFVSESHGDKAPAHSPAP